MLRVCCLLIVVCCVTLSHKAPAQVDGDSWKRVRETGKGTITVYWYQSRPFIWKSEGVMKGMEYEIFEAFHQWVEATYGVELEVRWTQASSFGDTYGLIRERSGETGIFGVSAFSVTPERMEQVRFSSSYMVDICVLITSKDIPIVQSREEFSRVFSQLTAITIPGTTYEQDILRLKADRNIDFKVKYFPGGTNLLREVGSRDSAFAFIDLPVYMMAFSANPSLEVKRQNLFPVRRKGYAFIHPLASDWNEPLAEFFAQKNLPATLESIIGRHLDKELYLFIESLATQSDDLVMLLTKEKEIQYNDLVGKYERIERETRTRNFLIALSAFILLSLIVIIVLYAKRNQQKKKIEDQRRSIEMKNQELEKRNSQLMAMDEEKTSLISILAHDLRTPMNHVQGLAEVLMAGQPNLPLEQRDMLQGISDAAVRASKMISNILDLDSIEHNRVKISMEPVLLAPLLNQVTRTFEKDAGRKDIRIYCSSPDDVQVLGDPLFVTEVVENLLSNAIKFSFKGKEVHVGAGRYDGKVRILVRDSGPGLTEADRALLFRKFQKLSARPTGGENSTGLGLSIVKRYMQLMSGRVWCESDAGRGATFVVEFQEA